MTDFNWQDLPRKATIKCGAGIYSERFRATKSETYRGYFGAEVDTTSGHLTPRMWLSKKPGGKPLDQKGADVRGQGAKLSWTQADSGRGVVLERGKIFYLNHQLLLIGDGKRPNSKSSFIRNASVGGAA